jgi:hypothetical protein
MSCIASGGDASNTKETRGSKAVPSCPCTFPALSPLSSCLPCITGRRPLAHFHALGNAFPCVMDARTSNQSATRFWLGPRQRQQRPSHPHLANDAISVIGDRMTCHQSGGKCFLVLVQRILQQLRRPSATCPQHLRARWQLLSNEGMLLEVCCSAHR